MERDGDSNPSLSLLGAGRSRYDWAACENNIQVFDVRPRIMTDSIDIETSSSAEPTHTTRRALLVADDGADASALSERLSAAGLGVETASVEEAARRASESAPSVVVLAFGGREGEGRLVSLARRMRAEPASFALPVVFVFKEDGR